MVKILLVEDNELNRDMLSRRLQRRGFHVAWAGDGQEALAKVVSAAPDLILMDLSLPVMDGWEVTRRLKAASATRFIPVIALTSHALAGDREKALAAGCDEYETKPVDLPRLVGKIEAVLDKGSAAPSEGRGRSNGMHHAGDIHENGVNGNGDGKHLPASLTPNHAHSTLPARPPSVPDKGLNASLAAGDTLRSPGSGLSRDGPDGGDTLRNEHPPNGREQPAEADETISGLPSVPGYAIMHELGRGGMGIVYKARHRRMNRLVALKMIDKKHLAYPDAVTRFYQEVQAAAQLTHPNIVLAYDAGEFGDHHFFAMEYVEGVNLRQRVMESGPLPVKATCNYIRQAARGLHHAYERGLVHRDIKPANLLITWVVPVVPKDCEQVLLTAGRAALKILDFGLALLHRPTDDSRNPGGMTTDGRVVGTADYMAPEQWMNAHNVDIRADLYSLGCTFYFLLTGHVPFPTKEPMEKMLKHHMDEPEPIENRRPDVPAELAAMIRRLMAKKPEQRFQRPAELAEALSQF